MMKRTAIFILAAATASLSSGSIVAQQQQRASATTSSTVSSHQALLNQYCVTCHNQRAKTAGLMFDTMDLTDISKNADVWEKAVRKLRGGMMPPPGARQPDRAAVESFVTFLETSLDAAAAASPNPGRVALHRLNRAEYANAIDDLFGLHIDAAALLPKDDQANGFDNVANVLKVSPSFLDQYVSAARAITNQAIGNPQPKPASVVFRPSRADQGVHIDGLPLGTRGGLLVDFWFPADGEYKFSINGLASAGYVRGLEYEHRVVVTIDGARVWEKQVGGEEDIKAIDQKQAVAVAAINGRFQNIPISVKAGPHKVGVTLSPGRLPSRTIRCSGLFRVAARTALRESAALKSWGRLSPPA
jgi:mono/diheme cytochrome c family protein